MTDTFLRCMHDAAGGPALLLCWHKVVLFRFVWRKSQHRPREKRPGQERSTAVVSKRWWVKTSLSASTLVRCSSNACAEDVCPALESGQQVPSSKHPHESTTSCSFLRLFTTYLQNLVGCRFLALHNSQRSLIPACTAHN